MGGRCATKPRIARLVNAKRSGLLARDQAPCSDGDRLADATVAAVADVEVALGVDRQAEREREARLGRETAVAGEAADTARARGAAARHRRDDPVRADLADA